MTDNELPQGAKDAFESMREWLEETIPEHRNHPWKPPGMRFHVEGSIVQKAEYADDLPDGEWEIVSGGKNIRVEVKRP